VADPHVRRQWSRRIARRSLVAGPGARRAPTPRRPACAGSPRRVACHSGESYGPRRPRVDDAVAMDPWSESNPDLTDEAAYRAWRRHGMDTRADPAASPNRAAGSPGNEGRRELLAAPVARAPAYGLSADAGHGPLPRGGGRDAVELLDRAWQETTTISSSVRSKDDQLSLRLLGRDPAPCGPAISTGSVVIATVRGRH